MGEVSLLGILFYPKNIPTGAPVEFPVEIFASTLDFHRGPIYLFHRRKRDNMEAQTKAVTSGPIPPAPETAPATTSTTIPTAQPALPDSPSLGPTIRASSSLDKLFTAMAKAQAEVKNPSKDATNPHFKNKYADLATVLDAVRPVFSKFGIAIIQSISVNNTTVSVTTILAHESGQYLAFTSSGRSQQDNPQGIGSTVTYLRRYGLQSACAVAGDTDDDGNGAAGPPAPPLRLPGAIK